MCFAVPGIWYLEVSSNKVVLLYAFVCVLVLPACGIMTVACRRRSHGRGSTPQDLKKLNCTVIRCCRWSCPCGVIYVGYGYTLQQQYDGSTIGSTAIVEYRAYDRIDTELYPALKAEKQRCKTMPCVCGARTAVSGQITSALTLDDGPLACTRACAQDPDTNPAGLENSRSTSHRRSKRWEKLTRRTPYMCVRVCHPYEQQARMCCTKYHYNCRVLMVYHKMPAL